MRTLLTSSSLEPHDAQFQCSIPEPIRSWQKYPKHQSIAVEPTAQPVEPTAQPLQVNHTTDTEHHDPHQTRTACSCVLPLPLATAQNADKASEAVRPIPRQGHSIVHASDACGNRERPTGRALPQAQHRSTPQQIRKDADVAPCCSRGARTRATCYRMRAATGRGVATPQRRAKVRRMPSDAQNRAVRPPSEQAVAAKHLGNDPGWQCVVCEQLRSRRAILVAHAMTKVRQDKAVHPS